MKSKFLTVHVLILLLSLTGNVFSKALPPGSGIGDVPANVLILLDKSGSMGARMTSGAGVYYPEAVALDSSNGDVYAGQYYTYGIKKFTYATNAVDSSFGSSGIYRGSGNCRSYYPRAMKVHNGFLYVAGYYQHRVFRVNLSTGVCDWNYYGKYPQTLDIQNNTLYSFNRSNLLVRNLSTNTNISCSYSGDLRSQGRYAYGMAVDHNGANMYLQYYSNLYRFTIGSNKCPSTTKSFSTSSPVGYYSFGMKMHPTDDSILYATSYYSHRIYKIVLNSGKTGVQSSTYKGSCCTGTSTNSNVKMYYPRNIDIDATNNRIAVAEYNKNSIQIFDLNLGFIKEIGGSSGTRMSGAHEAIKAIVTDASLTSGVDFGFAYWSSGSSGFQSWSGNITTGTASPCTSQNCLKVRAHKGGAARINTIISSVNPGGGTDAMSWATIAQQYYGHSSLSPIDANLSCQNSYVLVIGDGDWYNHSSAKTAVTNLKNQKKIKTFTVAYGGGISTSGIRYFREMAQAGGTNDVIIANTTASLKAQLKAAISQVIASKLSFTAPAITATIEKGGSLYQAQFDYVQNKEWQGTLTRTAISSGGVVNTADSGNWSAAQKLPTPSARKIWSVIPGTDYTTNYNNFTDTNWSEINTLFQQTNNTVAGYHSISDNPVNTRRCASTSGVANGTDDDVKGLINFIRGEDYFDYDADCNLTETRPNPLGDIYHSELIVVSAPNAETAFVGTNQEAYWRSIKGYDAWAASKSTREEIIYVGANDGLLHAFKAKDGVEKWAFAPPFVVSSMPLMVNANLNRGGAGGSNAVFGVDGSPVVHDMYFQSPLDNAKAWHTILFVPYGRGGAGFSVLDITDPAKPLHLYSVLNDIVLHKVHVMNQLGALSTYDYIATSYSLGSFIESVQVTDNFAMSTGTMTCDDTGNNQCFKSKTWTFPVRGISKADLTVIKDGSNYTNFTVTTNANGDTVLTFGADITYYGGDSGNASLTSTNLGVTIKPGSTTTGVLSQPEYEYSKLGETWSEPRIFRLPNDGAGDTNIEDDIYVATIGGGYGTQFEGVGSSLFIINLEDRTYPGKIHKVIDIEDMTSSDIVNSVPGTPVVVTADTARGIGFRGALVYTNDFEGKITKFNLTNMSDDGDGNAISLYDNTTLFNSGSTISNGRYMYHSMDATIGQTTNSLWLFSGTGDYERIAASSNSIQNLLLGISDPHYPLYKEVTTPSLTDDLTKCKNTTNDSTGASCPQAGDRGWYITLDDSKKVTAEPTVASGLVYFSIYKPSSSVNKCSLGDAFICAADDECGTNVSSKLGANSGAQSNEKCKYVGQGVLSRIVTFAGKLFANIAGQSLGSKKDLVTINTAVGDVSSYRSSWRQNY
jgi:type IV pilus assembly protein PilY1